MIATRDTIPFVLSGAPPAVTIDATGAPGFFPSASLSNPFNEPIEVRELQFQVLASGTAAAISPFIVDVRLRAGRHDLTNGYCPLFTLAPVYDSGGVFASAFVGAVVQIATLRWIFPRPMILPAGAAITGSMRVNPAIAGLGAVTGTVTVSMSVIAHQLPKGAPADRTTCIPFVSGALYVGVGGPVQNDLQLMNTLPVPLYVKQIIAAPMGLGIGFTLTAVPMATDLLIVGPGGVVGTPRRNVVDHLDSNGAFAQRHAIEIDHTLAPLESYKAVVYAISALSDASTAISIAGYREEAL